MLNMKTKVAIVHYRVGRTDGVSLEIEKRKQILEQLGCDVRLISGPLQNGADFIIDALEFERADINSVKENSFAFFNKNELTPQALMALIDAISDQIEKDFDMIHRQEKFDLLLVHNLFSHGRHIAAASAFTRFAKKNCVPIISTNHDYYWERQEYLQPTSPEVENYLNEFVPPKAENILHVSINSIARGQLLKLRNIDSVVFPDIFDFDQAPWGIDDYNVGFRKQFGIDATDIVALQATRIVARKGIEIAVDFVKELQNRLQMMSGHIIYNGRHITKNSRLVFLLAGYAEKSASSYLEKLTKIIKKSGIDARFIHSSIASFRKEENGKKIYSLWDAYAHSDFVTYPSLYEGWGNQFIEAVFARKPVVLYEYPVFKEDIKKEGYHYISLGHNLAGNDDVSISPEKIKQAADALVSMLLDKNTPSVLDENIRIGRKFHGYQVLAGFLEEQLKNKLVATKTF